MTSALGYVEETLLNAEIVKLVPKFLAPTVGGVLSSCLNSHKTFFNSLIPATEQRIQEKQLKSLGHEVPKRVGLTRSDTTTSRELTVTSRLTAFNGSLIQHPSRTPGRQSASSTSSWPFGSDRCIFCPRHVVPLYYASINVLRLLISV